VEREECREVTSSVPVRRRETVCRTVKKETCTSREVRRPKLVNRRVCRELSDKEVEEGKGEGGDGLTAYVNLDNEG
jgi:hypothetical protein